MQQMLFDFATEKKKTIVISLRPKPYSDIISGIKKYEYRRKFIADESLAFVYVSSPVQELKGYIEFGEPIVDTIHKIAEIAEQEYRGWGDGIYQYMDGLQIGYAIPIKSYKAIAPLSLQELKTKYNFTAPQSYFFLENNLALKDELLKRIKSG